MPERRKPIFLFLLVVSLVLLLILNWASAPLETPMAPYGMISYEFSENKSVARQILASWDEAARLRASFSLGLDYLFIPVYTLTIGLACVMGAELLRQRAWPLAGLGLWLAWGMFLAALCDGLENIALIALLFGAVSPFWAPLAYGCASLKFALILLGLVYVFYSGVIRLVIPHPEATISATKFPHPRR